MGKERTRLYIEDWDTGSGAGKCNASEDPKASTHTHSMAIHSHCTASTVFHIWHWCEWSLPYLKLGRAPAADPLSHKGMPTRAAGPA